MSFFDRARAGLEQVSGRADSAMDRVGSDRGSYDVDRYLRDLGMVAYLEATGRSAGGERERLVGELYGMEQRGAIRSFELLTRPLDAPPPSGAAAAGAGAAPAAGAPAAGVPAAAPPPPAAAEAPPAVPPPPADAGGPVGNGTWGPYADDGSPDVVTGPRPKVGGGDSGKAFAQFDDEEDEGDDSPGATTGPRSALRPQSARGLGSPRPTGMPTHQPTSGVEHADQAESTGPRRPPPERAGRHGGFLTQPRSAPPPPPPPPPSSDQGG